MLVVGITADGGGGTASAVNTTNQTVEQKIWSFFRGRGYTPAGIAGIMGRY